MRFDAFNRFEMIYRFALVSGLRGAAGAGCYIINDGSTVIGIEAGCLHILYICEDRSNRFLMAINCIHP